MRDRPSASARSFGIFELAPEKRLLLRKGTPVPLTPKAFDILVFLVDHRDRVVTKEELLGTLWPDTIVEEANLTQQVFLLRKALDDSSDGQRYIATIPRVGYRFVETVTTPGRPATHAWGRVPLLTGVAIAVVAAAVAIPRLRLAPRTAPYTFRQLTSEPGVESFPSLSPNGESIVYAAGPLDYPGKSRLYLRRVGQDHAQDLGGSESASDTQPAFSPNGEWIAFRSERLGGGIFRMRSSGGPALQVTDEGYNPAWSPDGLRIVYSTVSTRASPYAREGRGPMRIVDVESGARSTLPPDDAMQPSWSPHGHRIAYWTSGAIYTIATSGDSRQLAAGKTSPGVVYYWSPVWSPDGGSIYFSSNRGGTTGLWRVPVDERTGTPRGEPEAVSTPSMFAAHVSFSRAGDRFVFASLPMRIEVQRLQFDPDTLQVTGGPEKVMKDTRGWVWPEPSPDGRKLAFHSAVTLMQEDIYTANADGTGLTQLTDDAMLDRVPRWSPDGNRLAFYSTRAGPSNIWIVNAGGGGLRQLTFAPQGKGALFPVWSPDGLRMAAIGFSRRTFVFDVDRPWDPTKLTFLPPTPGQGGMQPWSWSRDSDRLAGTRAGAGGILVFSFKTGTYEALTNFGSTPVWLADDRRLMFAFEDRLFVVDSRTKETKEIYTFPQSRVAFVEGGGFNITRDSRTIYAAPIVREGDIWMATAK